MSTDINPQLVATLLLYLKFSPDINCEIARVAQSTLECSTMAEIAIAALPALECLA